MILSSITGYFTPEDDFISESDVEEISKDIKIKKLAIRFKEVDINPSYFDLNKSEEYKLVINEFLGILTPTELYDNKMKDLRKKAKNLNIFEVSNNISKLKKLKDGIMKYIDNYNPEKSPILVSFINNPIVMGENKYNSFFCSGIAEVLFIRTIKEYLNNNKKEEAKKFARIFFSGRAKWICSGIDAWRIMGISNKIYVKAKKKVY